MKKFKHLIILLSVMLIWSAFTLGANAGNQAYEVTLTSYTCEADSRNPMSPCGPLRWGGNVYDPGLACPVAWRNRRFLIPGYGTFRCDDTALQEYLYGLPHVDLRVATVYQARQIGVRRITIYDADANESLTNASTQANNGNSITYTVSAGDTLSTIAERYNSSVDTIRSHNDLTSYTIRIGQQLQIPNQTTEASTTITEASTTITTTNVTANSAAVHVVVPGDTLSGIAVKYNTTVESLRSSNSLSSNVIRIGQQLQVPSTNNAVSGAITHTVRQGESINTIANQYNVSTLSILEANNLQTPNLIQPGQQLTIPGR